MSRSPSAIGARSSTVRSSGGQLAISRISRSGCLAIIARIRAWSLRRLPGLVGVGDIDPGDGLAFEAVHDPIHRLAYLGVQARVLDDWASQRAASFEVEARAIRDSNTENAYRAVTQAAFGVRADDKDYELEIRVRDPDIAEGDRRPGRFGHPRVGRS